MAMRCRNLETARGAVLTCADSPSDDCKRQLRRSRAAALRRAMASVSHCAPTTRKDPYEVTWIAAAVPAPHASHILTGRAAGPASSAGGPPDPARRARDAAATSTRFRVAGGGRPRAVSTLRCYRGAPWPLYPRPWIAGHAPDGSTVPDGRPAWLTRAWCRGFAELVHMFTWTNRPIPGDIRARSAACGLEATPSGESHRRRTPRLSGMWTRLRLACIFWGKAATSSTATAPGSTRRATVSLCRRGSTVDVSRCSYHDVRACRRGRGLDLPGADRS
jgi:hypothetical protein